MLSVIGTNIGLPYAKQKLFRNEIGIIATKIGPKSFLNNTPQNTPKLISANTSGNIPLWAKNLTTPPISICLSGVYIAVNMLPIISIGRLIRIVEMHMNKTVSKIITYFWNSDIGNSDNM